MSTNFPTALDTLTNPTPTDYLNSPSHAGQHSTANDILEALEAKLGIDSSAVTTSHDYKLSEVTGTDKAVGKSATQTLTNKAFDNTSPTAFNPVGEVKAWPMKTAPTGYLLCDGSAISRTTYANLFNAIVPSIGTFTVSIATPAVVTLNNHGLETGDSVYLTTTGALPTGLSANTIYYVVKIDANTFNLATTFANANAGTKIATSGTQSGVHTLRFCPYGLGDGSTTFNVPNLKGKVIVGLNTSDAEFDVLGVAGAVGEKSHLNKSTESGVPAHTHYVAAQPGAGAYGYGPSVTTPCMTVTTTVANTAADAASAHNNIQPYLVMNFIIKT